MVLYNDTEHHRICKSVTEIKDHAKNFPNASRKAVNLNALNTLNSILRPWKIVSIATDILTCISMMSMLIYVGLSNFILKRYVVCHARIHRGGGGAGVQNPPTS